MSHSNPIFIDSHAHLFAADYAADLDDVLNRAADAGVESIVVPATNVVTSREAVALAEKHENIYACVGIHPHEASSASEAALQEIEELSRNENVVAVGEIGLDYYYNLSPREMQKSVFHEQIEMAVRRGLPIVVHTRDSLDDAFSIVERAAVGHPSWRAEGISAHTRFPGGRGVFHCFSGNADDAAKLLEIGFYVSYPGILTFKNSASLETLKKTGYDHILLETDSPYLTPVPLRGRRNEPSNLHLVAEKAADAFGVSVEDIARCARYNTKKLFRIGQTDKPMAAYKLKNSLYLNITLRCNADCVFCDRAGEAVVKGHNLKIEKEPSGEELIEAIGDPRKFDEIVFCGYGEPTIRLEVVKQVARWVKEHGGRVRLNTDGHGNIINHRNIVPELVGLIDSISISFNSSDPKQYGEIMRIDGERFHKAMVDFARESRRYLPEVVMTVVGTKEVNVSAAREFVEKEIGASFRVRPYF